MRFFRTTMGDSIALLALLIGLELVLGVDNILVITIFVGRLVIPHYYRRHYIHGRHATTRAQGLHLPANGIRPFGRITSNAHLLQAETGSRS
jgi:hypothetical protein